MNPIISLNRTVFTVFRTAIDRKKKRTLVNEGDVRVPITSALPSFLFIFFQGRGITFVVIKKRFLIFLLGVSGQGARTFGIYWDPCGADRFCFRLRATGEIAAIHSLLPLLSSFAKDLRKKREKRITYRACYPR